MSSIKENWRAFAEPMKQELENLRYLPQQFKDTVEDKMDEIKNSSTDKKNCRAPGANKGCSWPVIKWVLILCVIGAVLSECSNGSVNRDKNSLSTHNTTLSTGTDESIGSPLGFLEKQISYAEKHDIELNRFLNEEAMLANWLDNSNDNIMYLTTDNFFGTDKYKGTEKYDGYLYYGQMKNNRPDGYGILYVAPKNSEWVLTYEGHAFACRYIGQFSDGRFDGFGVLFTESGTGLAFVSRLRPYEESTGENAADFLAWANYAEYFGQFSEGYKTGLGNSFRLDDIYIGTFENALKQVDLDNPDYFMVDTGEYKKDELNGESKQYINGFLYYEGETKDGLFDGEGILYYRGTNIPSYKGEFKRDKRHGTGTSYNERGEITYQGEWRNDDYE